MTLLSAGRRDWHVIAGGAACCAIIWSAARGIPAARGWYESERSTAREVVEQRAVALAAIRGAPFVAESLTARRRAADSLERRFFVAPSVNAAASAAASHLSRLAERARLELASVNVLTDSAKSVNRRIVLIISARGDIHGVTRLIASLESGSKLVRVASLAITQPDVAAGPDVMESLNVQMSVEALARVGRSN